MTVYNLLREGLQGEGTEKMWSVTKILSDSIEEYLPEKDKESLENCLYYHIYGGHFNKEFADKVMPRFYYIGEDGTKHQAPYWAESEVRPLYEGVKDKVSPYNFYDFEVALNMIKSDNYLKLKKWFPEATNEEFMEKLVEETVNYLDDEDNPYGTEKIWRYLNS